MVLAQSIIADIFPPKERGKYMGIMGASFGVSMVLGPLIGGIFTEYLSWRWCFWINVPLGAAAFAIAAVALPHRSRPRGKRFDAAGTAFMFAASISLVLVLSLGGTSVSWDSPLAAALVIAFFLFSILFVFAEKKAADPIIPLRFFGNRNFSLCTMAGLIIMVGMAGVVSYMPTYFQIVNGLEATAAGYMMVPLMAGMMLMSTVSGFVAGKAKSVKWMPVLSCAIASIALALLSCICVDTPLWETGVVLFILGFGIGLGQQILVLIVQNEFSAIEVGTVTAANNFFREIGATIGGSLVGALFTANLTANLAAHAEGALASLDPNSITPSLVRTFDEGVRGLVQLAYSDALAPVFGWLVPLALAAFVMLLFLKKKPLSESN